MNQGQSFRIQILHLADIRTEIHLLHQTENNFSKQKINKKEITSQYNKVQPSVFPDFTCELPVWS